MANKFTELDGIYSNFSIKDKDDPLSLVNITPTSLSDRIAAIPDEIIDTPIIEIKRRSSGGEKLIGELEEELRISFAAEYRRAINTKTNINVNNVIAGYCSWPHFNNKIANNSFKLFFIISPVQDMHLRMEKLAYKALDKMEQILDADIHDDKVKNIKLGFLQERIFEQMIDRRRGHALKTMEVVNKNTNLNLNANVDATKALESRTVQELETKLAELEGRTVQTKVLPLPSSEPSIIDIVIDKKDVSEKV